MREDIKVKFVIYRYIAIFLLISGCVNIEDINRGVRKVDEVYKIANDNLLKTFGTRTYEISKKEAFRAMVIALTELGMLVVNQDLETGLIFAKGASPAPLTKSEWEEVKEVEEPRMRAIIASEVGDSTASGFGFIQPSDGESHVNIIMLERPADLQISFRFRPVYVGPKVVGLVHGDQPNPTGLKIIVQKVWNTFEKIAFIQKGTFK